MNDFFVILAIWRIVSLLVNEGGPRDIFESFRQVMHENYLDGIACFWCLSVWISFPFAFILHGSIFTWVLAYSAGAILIEEIIDWLQKTREHVDREDNNI